MSNTGDEDSSVASSVSDSNHYNFK